MTRNPADAEDLRGVREGLRGVHQFAGDEPQGMAVPDPHEHLHQHLPQEAASRSARPTTRSARRARASHQPTGLRSAETEAPTGPRTPTPGTLVQPGEDFRLAVYLADVEGFAYKEIARSWNADRDRDVALHRAAQGCARAAVGTRGEGTGPERGQGGRDHERRRACSTGRLRAGWRARRSSSTRADESVATSSVCTRLVEHCLHEYDVVDYVKALVKRSCGSAP